MKIFSAAQVRQWDAYTMAYEPISSINLMERAATACFLWLTHHLKELNNYVVFCGTGNNGGDGLAIARALIRSGHNADIYILEGSRRSIDFSTNLDRIGPLIKNATFINKAEFPIIPQDAIIIDALFGSGLSRPLDGVAAELVEYINHSRNTIISIDIPTGLFADNTSIGNVIIRATHTLCFQTHQLAFFMAENNEFTGAIHLLDIGLHPDFYNIEPAKFYTIDQNLIGSIYVPRNQFLHKYSFGHSLLYAGSTNMMGAAILCARACLRSGSGLVTVYTESNTQPVIQTAFPEAITSTDSEFASLSKKKSAIGIGPGLAPTKINSVLLNELITTYPGKLVIDATALQLLSTDINILKIRKSNPAILTPHTGEFEKLFGKTNNDFERMALALQQSKTLECYIILKGHHTLIACPNGDAFFNTTGNSGMATAGSGDVLTGVLTGLLAQGFTPKNACILGVYLHGLAGDLAAEKMSQEAMIAGDIIECLGEAFKKLLPAPERA